MPQGGAFTQVVEINELFNETHPKKPTGRMLRVGPKRGQSSLRKRGARG
jgi:hypothetical protein